MILYFIVFARFENLVKIIKSNFSKDGPVARFETCVPKNYNYFIDINLSLGSTAHTTHFKSDQK